MDLKLNFMKFSMRSFSRASRLFVRAGAGNRSLDRLFTYALWNITGFIRDLYCYTKPDYCVLCAAWIWPINDKKISWNRISIKP